MPTKKPATVPDQPALLERQRQLIEELQTLVNHVPYGLMVLEPGGVAAAAQFYFGKKITDVSLAESAMLAGLFKAPAKYAPHVNLPAARARANDVLSNLVQSGLMSEGQVIGARRNPATVIDRAEASALAA